MKDLRPKEGRHVVIRSAFYLLAFVGFLAGLLVNPLVLSVSLISAMAPKLYGLWYRYNEWWHINGDHFLQPSKVLRSEILNVDKMLPSSSEEKAGFIHQEYKMRCATCGESSQIELASRSREFDSWLRRNCDEINVEQSNEGRSLAIESARENHESVEKMLKSKFVAARRGNKMLTNEPKVGLFSDLKPGIEQVRLFRSSYFLTLVTNDFSGQRLVEPTGKLVTDKGEHSFPRDEVGNSGVYRMRDTTQTRYGNHIGASVLAATSNKTLVIWGQRQTQQQSEGLLAPSGSGSADFQDFFGTQESELIAKPGSGEFHIGLQRAMAREFLEESSKRKSRVEESPIEEVAVLGYFRWIRRGGKPDFVGLCKLREGFNPFPNDSEMQYAGSEVGVGDQHGIVYDSLEDLVHQVNNLKCSGRCSLPLLVNFDCLLDAIEEDPERMKRLLHLA